MKSIAHPMHLAAIAMMAVMSMPKKSFSWGGRGHDSICHAAVHLVQNEKLKEFLKFRPHVMGHLCNVPDIYWKSLPADQRKLGDPTHYIDPEVIGLSVEKIPLDFIAIQNEFQGQVNRFEPSKKIFSIPNDFGSIWWRADQFFRLAVQNGQIASKTEKPKNKIEEQNESLQFNQGIYQMITMMGIMGHYVGDVSQPLHNTADYDGYKAGHGGLHAYFEEAVVVHFSERFVSEIVQAALKQKNRLGFKADESTLEKMKRLSQITQKEIDLIYKKDPIIKRSVLTEDKGMKIKTAAERKSSKEGFNVYKEIILQQMGRSSLLLAHLWDQIYIQSQQPDLSFYKSYRYPFTPDFIAPDYMIKTE